MLFWFVLACGIDPEPAPRPSSPSSDRLLFPSRSDPENGSAHCSSRSALTGEHAGVAKEA